MAITITVNGIDVTTNVKLDSIRIQEVLRARGTSAEFTMRVVVGAAGAPAAPSGGNEVIITNGSTREFAGHLLVPSFEMWRDETGRAGYDFHCQCTDYSWELDKQIVYDPSTGSSWLYGSQAADVIVKDLVAKYADPDFTVTGVDAGLTAQDQDFDSVPLSDCINKLAQETGYLWYVDYSKGIQFFVVEKNQAPIATIDLDNETRIFNVEGDQGDVSQVHNDIYLKDVVLTDSTAIVETAIPNVPTRFLPLSYPPSPLAADTTFRLNGNAWQTQLDDLNGRTPTDGVTRSGTAFLCVFNRGVRLGSAVPANSTAVNTYLRVAPRLARKQDPASIADMAAREGRTDGRGNHQVALNLPQFQAATNDVVEYRLNIALLQQARPRIRVRFKTLVTGFSRGQYAQVLSSTLNVNRRLYVQSITKSLLDPTTMAYEIGMMDQLLTDSA